MKNSLEIPVNWNDELNAKLFRFRGWRKRRRPERGSTVRTRYPIYILTTADYRVVVKIFYLNKIEVVITETTTNRVLCSDFLKILYPQTVLIDEIIDAVRSIYIDVIYHGFRRQKWDGLQRGENTSLERTIA